jgi:hypothetical protein
MSEHAIRSVLRILAVATVFIGAILTTASVFAVVGLEASVGGVGDTGVAAMAQAVVWGHASIVLWGLLLYAASGVLARWIAN